MKTKTYIVGENSPNPIAVDLPETASIDDIKQFAIDHGLTTETNLADLQVFAEDTEEEFSGAELVRDLPAKHNRRRFFCGRCHKLVKVTIAFETREIDSKFWAGSQLERVFDWAIRELELAEGDAENLVLRMSADSDDSLDLDHILASLVHHHSRCSIKLFLTTDVFVNG